MKNIFITLVAIIILVGGTYYVLERRSPVNNACAQYTEQKQKDVCLLELSVTTNDKKVCQEIEDKIIREACDSGNATSTSNLYGGLELGGNTSADNTTGATNTESDLITPSEFIIPKSYKMHVFATDNGWEFFTSENGGDSWQSFKLDPMEDEYPNTAESPVVAMSADAKRVVVADYSPLGQARIYTTTNGGRTWGSKIYENPAPMWADVAMSADGKTVTLASEGTIYSEEKTDRKLGDIFELSNPTNFSKNLKYAWTSIGVSPDGKYELASYVNAADANNTCGIYLKSDMKSWAKVNTPMCANRNYQQSMALSAGGKYMIVSGSNTGGLVGVSDNYGKSFSGRGPKGVGVSHVAMSWDGKYMGAVTDYDYGKTDEVFVSADYGKTWQKSTAFPGTSTSGQRGMFISPDGKEWAVIAETGDTAGDEVMYVSKDYGKSWSKKFIKYETEEVIDDGESDYAKPYYILVGWSA